MALYILDGNQSATTLSTILSSGQHITAHTVVSLGTQAITDIVNATSAGLTNTQLRASAVTIAGTVTANAGNGFINAVEVGLFDFISNEGVMPISGTVTANLGSALPAGTNRIGVVTIGAGTVTIGAGFAQIGTVTVGNISSLPDSGGNAVVRNFVFGYDYDEEVPVAIASDGTALSVAVANAVRANLISALPAGTKQHLASRTRRCSEQT